MCLLEVIDACVFGGAPRETGCARLAQRPACVVNFLYYVSSCGYQCLRLWWGASRGSLRLPRSAPCLRCGLHMICGFLGLSIPASLVGRLTRLAALASLGALLALWTSYVMCLLVVIDACVFGGTPREPRCARLARRPACVVDFICYVFFLWLLMRVS